MLWVHPAFHVSFLKKVIGDKIPIKTIFPKVDEEGKVIVEPKKNLKQRPSDYEIRLLLSTSSNERTY
jgi:hypothetical protein